MTLAPRPRAIQCRPSSFLLIIRLVVGIHLPAASAAADCLASIEDCEPASAATVVDASFSRADWARLEEGRVVFEMAEARDEAQGAVLVEAGVGHAWEVLTDFRDWPRIVPHVEEIAVRRGGAGLSLRQRMKILWKRFDYTVRGELDPERRWIHFDLDRSRPGDLDRLEARFELTDLGGRRTLIRFHSLLEAGVPLPGFVRRAVARSVVPDCLRAVREEIVRRAERSRQTAKVDADPL